MAVLLALWLAGCAAAQFNHPGVGGDSAAYEAVYPYYAEFCALSELRKKPGFGAEISGQIGGHSVFYLNGACRDTDTDYPALHVCAAGTDPENDGVGISMNSHFRNAKWVAVPGRAFFFDGGLRRDQRLTRADYFRVQARARQLHLYRDVTFHTEVFDDKPADMSREAYKYEVSIATDYAISFGRGRFCARVPVSRAQLADMVDYLNAQNQPYRDGHRPFEWSVFQDNCIHLAHNTLTAAGIWPEWPTDLPLPLAFLDFPVPKNEFVDLMLRTNDPESLDPLTLYRDPYVRESLLRFGRLPWEPGALAESRPPQEPNEIYHTHLRLVFYESPFVQWYQRHLDTIFAEPRYYNIERNMDHFVAVYRQMREQRQPLSRWLARADFSTAAEQHRFATFYQLLYAYVDREQALLTTDLDRIRLAATPTGHLLVLSDTTAR